MRGRNKNRFHMLVIDKHIVIADAKYRSKWWRLSCTCGESRRRKDGSCKHLRCVWAELKPEVQTRTRFNPSPMGSKK